MSASELWVAAQPAIPSWAREHHSDHDLTGAMALGGNDLGFGRSSNRSKLHLARNGGAVSGESAWSVGFRSTLQETSKRELKTIHSPVSQAEAISSQLFRKSSSGSLETGQTQSKSGAASLHGGVQPCPLTPRRSE